MEHAFRHLGLDVLDGAKVARLSGEKAGLRGTRWPVEEAQSWIATAKTEAGPIVSVNRAARPDRG